MKLGPLSAKVLLTGLALFIFTNNIWATVPDTLNTLKVCRSYRYGDTMLTIYKKKCL